jgi:hypothetical protein
LSVGRDLVAANRAAYHAYHAYHAYYAYRAWREGCEDCTGTEDVGAIEGDTVIAGAA